MNSKKQQDQQEVIADLTDEQFQDIQQGLTRLASKHGVKLIACAVTKGETGAKTVLCCSEARYSILELKCAAKNIALTVARDASEKVGHEMSPDGFLISLALEMEPRLNELLKKIL